jgi:hypothetical protein
MLLKQQMINAIYAIVANGITAVDIAKMSKKKKNQQARLC